MLLPKWPPTLPVEQLNYLTFQATTYALACGLLYLPPTDGQPLPPIPAAATHAPFALFPTPFPKALFERAQRLQHIYNVLYARVASDDAFLDEILSAATAVGRVDQFVGALWRIWKDLRDDGLTQSLQLGIFRSDYLMHHVGDKLDIKQVEFNTISSSFGALSQRVAGLHKYLQSSTGYCSVSPLLIEQNLPANTSLSLISEALTVAHATYKESIITDRRIAVLFVIQPGERNVFDQRSLEYEILERHSIPVHRRTFDQLRHEASLDPSSLALLLQTTEGPKVEISVVYYRAGYTPTDYTTSAHYDVRKLLERSLAIKCPSIALQLAGSKKIQAILAKPGVVESFLLPNSSKGYVEPFTEDDVNDLRASWVDMWGLEESDGVSWARERHQELVLKPQREGGGNNVYKGDIPGFLDRLDEKERQAWIAMELIKVPKGGENYLVRSGSEVVRCRTVSELGTFGWALFGKGRESRYGEGGYLLRTKGEDSDEGGVAAGFSVLDSVVLVD